MHKFSKRTLAVVVPVAALSVVGIAYAASLTVTSTTLGGGTSTVANACAIDVSYDEEDLTYSNAANGYVLAKVNVRPSAASGTNCDGDSWRVTVTDALGDALGEAKGEFAETAVAMNNQSLTESVSGTPITASAVAEVYATATDATGDAS